MSINPETRIKIIVDWINRHPKQFEDAKKSLKTLDEQFKIAKKSLRKYTKDGEQGAVLQARLNDVYNDAKEKIIKQNTAMAMANEALKRRDAEAKKGNKVWLDRAKSFSKFGRTVGFYGFIVSFSIQRIIRSLGQVASFFMGAIDNTAKWVDGLVQNRMALAYLRKEGEATPAVIKQLDAAFTNLRQNGAKVEALWMGLQAQWESVKQSLAIALIPILQQLVQLVAVELNKPETRQIIAQIAIAFGELAKAIIPVIPMVLGIAKAVVNFLVMLQPTYKVLVPVISILFILGTVCTLLGPIIITLGYAITSLIKVKAWWGQQTMMTVRIMGTLQRSLVLLLPAIIGIISVLWYMTRESSTATKSLEDTVGAMSTDITTDIVNIVDEFGNLIYTINTVSGDVRDAAGEIIGHWNSMDKSIRDDKDNIIGYYDDISREFYGLAGDMEGQHGRVETAIKKLETAINGIDFSGFEDAVGDMSSGFETQLKLMETQAVVSMGIMLSSLTPAAPIMIPFAIYFIWKDDFDKMVDDMSKSLAEALGQAPMTFGPGFGGEIGPRVKSIFEIAQDWIMESVLNTFGNVLGVGNILGDIYTAAGGFQSMVQAGFTSLQDWWDSIEWPSIPSVSGEVIEPPEITIPPVVITPDFQTVLEAIKDSDIEWAFGGLVRAKGMVTEAMATGSVEAMQTALNLLAIGFADYYEATDNAADMARQYAESLGLSVVWTNYLLSHTIRLAEELKTMCFSHAIPMANEYSRVLGETTLATGETIQATTTLTNRLLELSREVIVPQITPEIIMPVEVPDITAKLVPTLEALPVVTEEIAPRAVGEGGELIESEITYPNQYITVYSTIHIGNISSEFDLDTVVEKVEQGLGDAIRKRRL